MTRPCPADGFAMALRDMGALPELPVEQKLVLYGSAAVGVEPDDVARIAVEQAAEVRAAVVERA